mgnify:CR=1 FL=1
MDKRGRKSASNRAGGQPFCQKGCGQRNFWLEPPFGRARGARLRAERRGNACAKRMGGAVRRQRKSQSISRK